MSLTRHLKRLESPVRQFVYASAPDLAVAGTRGAEGKAIASEFAFDELTALATQIPIPHEVKPAVRKGHAIVAGMALDYRIRMDLPGFSFSDTVAQKGLERLERDVTVIHRGKHLHKLLQEALGFAYLTHQEPDSHPLSLARASVPLAWCEAIYRTGPEIALSGALGKQIKRAKDAVELMMSIDDALIFDIVRMHKPLEPLLGVWNQEVAGGANYEPNPNFLGSQSVGGADADWVIGDTLVELKTREKITNPWLRDTLFQLIGYTLLDLDDSLSIRRVGILLPRQPYFAHWAVSDLLGRDADEALPELREEFAGLLNEILQTRFARALDKIAAAEAAVELGGGSS